MIPTHTPATPDPLTFGIYPGGPAIGEVNGITITGPANDPARIREALAHLHGEQTPFVVRGYMQYLGRGRSGWIVPEERSAVSRQWAAIKIWCCASAAPMIWTAGPVSSGKHWRATKGR